MKEQTLPTANEIGRAIAAVHDYGAARCRFRDAQENLSLLLAGNDNKVGVIGEFWSKLFYIEQGYVLGDPLPSNEKSYDFKCTKDGQLTRVSVKVVSDESKTGAQLPLKVPHLWDELVLILLSVEMKPYRIGRATQQDFASAVAAGKTSNTPTVRRSWLGEKGWMSNFATTYTVTDSQWIERHVATTAPNLGVVQDRFLTLVQDKKA
jgi:hypothetical protein